MLSAPERAARAGLRYVEPDALPLRRRRQGRGFSYVDRRSRPVRDPPIRGRLEKLAVPPAWREVRLARDPRSNIQAVGRYYAGRLHYRYH
jgi:DNA topoisomerase-1